jgi:hypothetical protein
VILEANGKLELTLIAEALEIPENEAIPKITPLQDILRVETSLSLLEIPMTATMIDMSDEIEVTPELDFGPVFVQKPTTKLIELKNPSRRPLQYKLQVEEDYQDIFTVSELAEGSIPPKETIMVPIMFTPAIGVTYSTSVYMALAEKVKSIQLYGQGVEPTLNVSYDNTDFGVVGVSDPEVREITVTNPTPLPIRVRPQSDNPDFAPIEEEVELQPGETRKIQILFRPRETNQHQVGKVTLYQIHEFEEGDEMKEIQQEIHITYKTSNSRPASREVKKLNDVVFEGRGGKFGFNVTGMDIDQDQKPTSEIQHTKIQIKFARLAVGKKAKKMFEVENSGDTTLEFGCFDEQDLYVGDEYISKTGAFRYSVAPKQSKIHPSLKEKITISLEAIQDGPDEFEFFVKTKNLARNKVVQVKVSCLVYTPSDMDNLRAFVRADDNIETKYDLKAQEERLITGDLLLWKVLSPVVRLGALLPSKELQYIPPVEPNVGRIEMGPFVVRPPAIPELQPPKQKKWYTNRISMAVDKIQKMQSETQEVDKKSQMVNFLQQSRVEKSIQLEKRKQ